MSSRAIVTDRRPTPADTPPDADPAIETLRRCARRTMAQHPGIEAVLLFGSRARGDHRADSDYDVAVLTRPGHDDEALRQAFDADIERTRPDVKVDTWTFEAQRIHRTRHLIGNIAHGLHRNARALAGQWPPTGDASVAIPDNDTIDNHLEETAQYLKGAAQARAELAVRPTSTGADKHFQHNLQMAAEFWAKAVSITWGKHPETTHDMAKIANDLQQAAGGNQECIEWAKVIRSLNGGARRMHIVPYDPRNYSPNFSTARPSRAI